MVAAKLSFFDKGLSWAERARLNPLEAVISIGGGRGNVFSRGIHAHVADAAIGYFRRNAARPVVVDFGCGNGRFCEFFARRGCEVRGTEITPEMLENARTQCGGLPCTFDLTDGISLPFDDNSINGISCCGVLRYSLLVEDPCYDEIAREFHRVLAPGASVVNCEMYVDVPSSRFTEGFEKAGFVTEKTAVVNGYGFIERVAGNRRLPAQLMYPAGRATAAVRSLFTSERSMGAHLRDYMFVWTKK